MTEELLDRKKKLVIATDNFLPRWDGIARFLSEIIPRLYKHYEIIVIAPDYGTYEDPHIKLVKIPLMKLLKVGDFPIAEKYYERAITLPIFPAMTEKEISKVINAVKETINFCAK